jgi:hypothetical protein
MLDFNDPKYEIQEWMVAYKKDMWKTINLPGDLSQDVVERIILHLNKKYEVIFARRIMGVFEEGKKNRFQKGDFIGI